MSSRSHALAACMCCCVAVLLLVGATPASAYWPSKAEETEASAHGEEFVRETEPFDENTEICNKTCGEGKIVLPPGWYLHKTWISGHNTFRTHDVGEIECRDAETGEGCTDYHQEEPETTEYLASGYKEFSEISQLAHDAHDAYFSELVYFYAWKPLEKASEQLGLGNPSQPGGEPCVRADPVNCATGNQVETQTDLTVGGRGLGLNLTRTYNSRLAAKQTEHGSFGYGWTGSYSAHLQLGYEGREATVYQDNGSTATFGRSESGAAWTAASSLDLATLVDEGSGYVYTLPDQTTLHFNSEGKLTSEADRYGNTLTMGYESGRLVSVTDGAGRKLTFAYNGEGEIESAKDPMGHTVKYTYEHGNLKSVTQPAESGLRWQFEYNG